MSTFKGNDGVVKLGTTGGTNVVGEVKSYSLEHTSDTVEDTAMGDASRTHIATLKSFSGSLDVFWDDSDADGKFQGQLFDYDFALDGGKKQPN